MDNWLVTWGLSYTMPKPTGLYADEKQTFDMHTKPSNSPALVCIFTAKPLPFVSTLREMSATCLPSA